MKKLLLLTFLFIPALLYQSKAAIVIVTVSGTQFTPANVTVQLGDIIRYNFVAGGGFHNATSAGDPVPVGAPAIFSGAPAGTARTYDYTTTVIGSYNYHCQIHGGGGMVGAFTVSAPLPLRLISFNSALTDKGHANLEWKTADEQDVSFFSVRRSIDGKNFTEIGRVTAGGQNNSYHFADSDLPQNRYVFYELAIQDVNGSLTYSGINMLKNNFISNTLIAAFGPNPINPPEQLHVQYNAEKDGWIDVEVFDVRGKTVLKTSWQAFAGLNNSHLHVCELKAGTYEVRFSYEGKTETKTLVIQ